MFSWIICFLIYIQIYINISFLYFKECRENYDNLSRLSFLMEIISIEGEFLFIAAAKVTAYYQ